MKRALAVLLLVGLSIGIAEAEEEPTPPASTQASLTPDRHWRLAKLPDAQPQTIGLLTYYPNEGGGYTFLEHGNIVFYAVPYFPTTYQIDRSFFVVEVVGGRQQARRIGERINVSTIGTSAMPRGGQTLYRNGTTQKDPSDLRREDVPIAKWGRAVSGDKFQLSILDVDRETRLKLKSIVPLLEKSSNQIRSSDPK
jgi:hypothetical protein